MSSRRFHRSISALHGAARVSGRHGSFAGALCAAGLVVLFANCSSASMAPRTPAAAERIIAGTDFGGSVAVKVGDVLVVRRPMNAAEWQVTYDGALLQFQGTPENLARPGDNGWTFRIVGAGDTSLTVSPVMRGGPNPPRFTVGIHIDA